MQPVLNLLFDPEADAKDGMTQTQREAIVDLLHYCMYADNLVTISEARFIEAKVRSYSWDPNISREYYLGKSIGAARAALANAEAKKKFLESITRRLETDELRTQAFGLCDKLFRVDGSKPAEEYAVQGEVRQALGLA